MSRIFSIILLIASTFPAFAADTSADANGKAPADYRAKLVALRSEAVVKGDAALNTCERARQVYLEVSKPLDSISGLLSGTAALADASQETVADADYRKQLTGIKNGYDAQILEAKAQAKAAGSILVLAEAQVDGLDEARYQIDAAAYRESMLVKNEACRRDPLACSVVPERHIRIVMEGISDSNGRNGRSYDLPYGQKPLPDEFAGCFPKQVQSGSIAVAPKVYVPPPPFQVELYPLSLDPSDQ